MSTGFDESVPFDAFTMDDVDADNVVSAGGGKLPEGSYGLLITEVVLKDQYGNTTVECEVVLAKNAALVGKKHYEYLRWPAATDKDGGATAKRILLGWCYAAKTTSPEEIKARQQARQGFNAAWLESMVGRQVLAFVKAEEYEGKQKAKIQGNVWALDDPKGKRVADEIGLSQPVASAANATKPASEKPAVAASDPFGGLV